MVQSVFRKRGAVVQEQTAYFISEIQKQNAIYTQETGKTKKCLTHTFGCQMNERDSEILFGFLAQMGYEKTDNEAEADFILFNTCCIREKAESKVLSQLGELKKLKQKHSELIIGVCGCMMQQKGMADMIRSSAPHVDLIFGTHNLHHFPEYLYRIYQGEGRQVVILDKEEGIQEGLPSYREYPFKALVNIVYGCNNFCTYCIVPYVRGRERSRRQADIVQEVKNLVADGVVEVTLLGQNVNSYGLDLQDGTTFAGLLRELDQIEGLRRIRYMTSHPKDLTEDLVKTIAESTHVVDHFHLPVQSGSTRVLGLMNRRYTREDYLNLVDLIRKYMPDAAITTDIIVGFPGETEEDFLDTVDLVRKVKFDNAFSFVYSKRAGTPAARMEDPVTLDEKKQRLQRLNDALSDISRDINDKLQDRTVEVLVEGPSKTNEAMLTGRTTTNKTVIFAGDPSLIGQIVPVHITEAQTWVLKGALAE
ncbi:MAG: tRNA (N6-isopentenyl adenosine(37)-C2)-methylthiotransferase MiaB [Peptococcaceae bacterium]|nr:tRNA (N6-isopentenyl adenosine(37)-C2)-methylthiotransferase MiaB [Peptococcaceae bacterium]MBQ2994126.1 tRNA (N6-isopentenyl adenosine(37)-C2)-methylthiotransferase MiaB [Peptococcaceae bacterium]